ncbi:MAG: SRPBCC family protein [Alphaproteobacteria bacterium]|nr:SRPBCC family protein [Alphaproteobacteria bacterium]
MREFVNEAHIEAPPAAVWAVLGEGYGDLGTWARLGASTHLEAPGPVGVGTTRVVVVPYLGSLRETIVAWEPEHLLVYEVHGLPGLVRSVQSTWTVDAEGEGTRVRMVSRVTSGWGLAGALSLKLSAQSIQSMLGRMVRALKRRVERGAPA